jgi:replicative DNA helicase
MNVDVDVLNESRVLGGLMEFGDQALWDLHWDVKYFDDTGMQTVMQLILEQVDANEAFDRFTVAVKAQRKFGNGDLKYRILCCHEDKPFTMVDLKFWHGLLVDAWREREVQLQAKRMLDNPDDIPDAMQAIAEANSLVKGFDVLKTVQEDYDEHLQVREDGVALLPTGEPSIDRLLGGGWRAGIYGIAGRPKQGKSMVMLHFARKLAEQGRNVLFVSYEMDKHQVYDRLQAAVLGIDSNKIAKNELDFDADGDGVWARDKVRFSKDKMPGSLVITAPVDRDVTDLYKLIERTRQKLGGLDAVFVDYAQIMTLPKHRGTEAEMHSALSSRLQQLAMHVNMPVITGLQLRKPDTANEKRVPGTSDIAGSDKYARDVVGILYIIRSHVEGDDPMFGVGSELILKLDTSRFTPPGSARFIAEDKFSRIVHKEWR